MTEFCCEEMATHLRDNEVSINYDDKSKSFGIYYVKNYWKVDGMKVEPIDYCPWCGIKLNQDK